ncbi:MAG: ABC transporter ATP-binding protein [Candidatus Thermoplasmatota archaeon]|nr:ABC transporter ATP-binding protein [Candidatus Thermoplasmatota archaeon]
MLEVRNLSKSFRKVKAVVDFNLEVRDGEAVGLVGPNGSGKTTAIRCICGIMRPDSAEVRINGHDLYDEPVEAKRDLGYVPEIPYPFPHLTVWEHVMFMARAFSVDAWEPKAEELLRMFNMTEKRDELCVKLSKGMKQKVMLMSAFIHDPTVLLMDEPLYGIDPRGSYALKNLVRERISAGASVVISSHTLSLIEEVCTRVAIMSKGRIIASGTYEELRRLAEKGEDATLEETFVKITEG